MPNSADHFEEILRQAAIVVADLPPRDRLLGILQYTTGSVIGLAAEFYDKHAYSDAQDLIELCALMTREAHAQQISTDPDALEFATRAMARLAGVPIPEPKIPQDKLDDREAAKSWAREILELAPTAPEKSVWLHIDNRCCFGGSLGACGKPIEGVQIIASGDSVAAVCYCEAHGKIMAEAVAERRSTRGSMTADEIERMSEGY